jgi:membrane fusion protein, multidrug efflux system
VIASGLQPGMTIVSAGVHVLSPGQKVTIWQDKMSFAPALAHEVPVRAGFGEAAAATLATKSR